MGGKEARPAGSTSPVLAIKRNRDQFAALSGPRLAYQGNAPSGALSSPNSPRFGGAFFGDLISDLGWPVSASGGATCRLCRALLSWLAAAALAGAGRA
jgi:hypothetical protein